MRWWIVVGLFLAAAAARSEGIVGVLERSQQMRLDALHWVDPNSAAARHLQRVFDALKATMGAPAEARLQVVSGDQVGETLLGNQVVVNAALAGVPDAMQRFILAHELGHVMLEHSAQMQSVYLKWIPGDVVPEQTNAVARPLGQEASSLAHRQELAADAFALRTLLALGHTHEEVLEAFMQMGINRETPTHPGTARRVANLRALQSQPDVADLAASARTRTADATSQP